MISSNGPTVIPTSAQKSPRATSENSKLHDVQEKQVTSTDCLRLYCGLSEGPGLAQLYVASVVQTSRDAAWF